MAHLHPVFSVVKLAPAPNNPIPGHQRKPPPTLEIVDAETHYVVEEILNSRLQNGRLEFLIKWEGYGYEENSWEVEGDVTAPKKVQEFYQRNPGAPHRIRSLAFQSLVNHAVRTQHLR